MRKSFDGLSGLVKQEMKQHVLGGDVFIFFNRRHNQVKLLCWDKDGLAVYHKRLEKGTFEQPAAGTEPVVTLTALQLRMILDGIQLKSIKHRPRYRLTG
ncbi:MAG: IS66 family insertion sequence element accessory protein TnpB [Bacteroidetes bacterium]|nr:IS66 family insertion sequence element accessory protein TnpB [Bacteroidota bacterium]